MLDETNPNNTSSGGFGDGGGIVGTLLQVAGAVYNGQVAKRNTDKTIEANKEQAQYAYSQEQAQWERNNAYNSPEAQMARLKEAGLNPNMLYGSGSAATGNTQQMPKYNAPSLQYNYRPMVDLPAILSQYQDFQMRQAQINNVKAQTDNTRSRTISEASRNLLLDAQGQKTNFDLDTGKMLRPFNAQIAENEARSSELSLKEQLQKLVLMNQQELMNSLHQKQQQLGLTGTEIENQKRQAELIFQRHKNELIKMGVTTSDHPAFRMLIQAMSSGGENLKALFNKSFNP